MHDQANDLRRLVRDTAAPPADSRPSPGLAVVNGGKGGVGTTTIALNLAVAMARRGLRTMLVDADPDGGDVAVLCGLEHRYTLGDVLCNRRSVAQTLQPGPGSLSVLPGVWGLERLSDFPPAAGGRLLTQLQELAAQTDLIVLDAGNRPNRMMQRFWQVADLNLVATTAETASVLDTYSMIKLLASGDGVRPIHSLVNLADSGEAAADVHRRLAQACHRFLGIAILTAGHLPYDPAVPRSGRAAEPFVTMTPDSPASRQMARLATTLASLLAVKQSRPIASEVGGAADVRRTA